MSLFVWLSSSGRLLSLLGLHCTGVVGSVVVTVRCIKSCLLFLPMIDYLVAVSNSLITQRVSLSAYY